MGTAADMAIYENLALAARRGKSRTLAWGASVKENAEYKDKLAGLGLGLEDRLTSKVGLLSGGQRQALTLLMATLKSRICSCSMNIQPLLIRLRQRKFSI